MEKQVAADYTDFADFSGKMTGSAQLLARNLRNPRNPWLIPLIGILIVCLLSCAAAFAQATAGISGTVKDSTGPLLPGCGDHGHTNCHRTDAEDSHERNRILLI